MEQTEASLMKETHELREQNELLEFRIIELEESHDKVSVCFFFFFYYLILYLKRNFNEFSLGYDK